MSARQPAATAMAAMTMDHLSGGRFILGLGVSGPQVVEGWYGMPFAKPLARTREYIGILRDIWAREGPVDNDGRALPAAAARRHRAGQAAEVLDPPAARGHPDLPRAPRGRRTSPSRAELCDGWLAMLFSPGQSYFTDALAEGFAKPGARRSAEDFEVAATVPFIVTDDVEAAVDAVRPFYALYFGGMGAKGRNFHANVAIRMGYEEMIEKVQDLYLDGQKNEAAAAIPRELIEQPLADRPAGQDPPRPRALARVGRHHAARRRGREPDPRRGRDRARGMSESTLAGHAGSLHVRRWEREDPERIVVLVHGYGEHIGRYEHVAQALVQRGATVWGHDHAGHGRSAGERVLVPDFEGLVDDLHLVVEAAREADPGLPVVMVAHSMGGMIGVRYAERHPGELAGLVISGPILGAPALLPQLLALDEIPEVPIDVDVLSRDATVGEAYAADPLVWHGPFKRPTVAALVSVLLAIALDASKLTGPVLWQHGAEDQLVLEAETRRGIDALRTAGADIEERIYPGARHEIFNEVNRDEVLADTAAFVERVS